jgi:dTDP-4-amino-4,6-dideoxygalactose transaminase
LSPTTTSWPPHPQPEIPWPGVDAYDRQTHGRAPQAEVITPGFKYNLADINAALALVQLDKLSHANQRRTEIAQRYLRELADTPFKPLTVPAWEHQHAWHLFIIRVDEAACGHQPRRADGKAEGDGHRHRPALPRGPYAKILPRAFP